MNECEIWDECDQDCRNTIGSYECTCRANYTLEAGNRCKHINSKLSFIISTNSLIVLFSGDNMKMYVAIANKIYEIDRLGNARILYTGLENMTIQAIDYHYRNQLLYFTEPAAHRVWNRKKTFPRTFFLTNVSFRFSHYHWLLDHQLLI